jgi:hypothetical protein
MRLTAKECQKRDCSKPVLAGYRFCSSCMKSVRPKVSKNE